MVNFNQSFNEAINKLNAQQQEAVRHLEGPVLVVAGPGTGKTQILAARIGTILQQTDTGPENILALTFTDAGTIAMRKRLIEFIGPEAYKININTFHAFSNNIIQEHPYLFAKGALEPISDLEEMKLLEKLIMAFPAGHPLKKWKGDNVYDRRKLKGLFDTMKKEMWQPDWLIKKINQWIEDEKLNDKYIYQRKYKDKKKGDLKEGQYEKEVLKPMRLLKSAVAEYPTYQNMMKEIGRYDYNDMIRWVLDKFEDEEHQDLLRDYQEQYHYILVDEYQDTNGTQNQLLYHLISYWDEPNVFVVGDDDQSIYRFQGANVANITEFSQKYSQHLKVIELLENYRSTQQVLDAAHHLISFNNERLVNELAHLTKNLNAALRKSELAPQVRIYQNQAQQSYHIATEIEDLLNQKKPLHEVAIIYSKHKYAEDIMQYFDVKEIPYQVKLRYNVLESVFINNLLNILIYVNEEGTRPHSREDLLFEMMHYPWFGIHSLTTASIAYKMRHKRKGFWREIVSTHGLDQQPDIFNVGKTEQLAKVRKLSTFIEKWIPDSKSVTVPVLIEKVIAESGLLNYVMQSPEKISLMEELRTFYDFVKEENSRAVGLNIAGLMASINDMKSNEISLPVFKLTGDPDGVMLTTAHGSKGLEFEQVYLIQCTQEAWEKQRSSSMRFKLPGNLVGGDQSSDTEEKRRLFYVAITRAKEHLYLSLPKYNHKDKELARSQFVTEVLTCDAVTEQCIDLSANEITDFQLNLLQEKPAKDIVKIEKQLIDRVLQKYQLSVTHLSSYLKCPRNFYFNHILRVPAASNHNMAFGNVMHQTLEEYFQKMREHDSFPSKAELLNYFDKYMRFNSDSFTDEKFDQIKEYGHHLLPQYYDRYINEWHQIVSLEHVVQHVIVQDIPIKGILDKIEFNGNDANVVDYKTGKYKAEKFSKPKPPEKWKDQENPTFAEQYGGDYWRQGVFYKILVDADASTKWNVVSTEFDFLEKDAEKDIFQKKLVPIVEDDLSLVREQIEEAWNGIQAHQFDGECRDPYCRWCSFVENNYDKLPEATEEDDIELNGVSEDIVLSKGSTI